jgi:hypothetical protein
MSAGTQRPTSAASPRPLPQQPAAGDHVKWTAVDAYRMEDRRIAEWVAEHLTAIVHGMGVHTPPWLL